MLKLIGLCGFRWFAPRLRPDPR